MRVYHRSAFIGKSGSLCFNIDKSYLINCKLLDATLFFSAECCLFAHYQSRTNLFVVILKFICFEICMRVKRVCIIRLSVRLYQYLIMKKLKFIFITFIVYSISLFILRAEQKKKCNKICWLSVKLNRKGALARDVPFVHSFILHSIFNFFLFMARNNWILWRFQMKKKKQFVPVGAHGNGCITTYSVVQFDFFSYCTEYTSLLGTCWMRFSKTILFVQSMYIYIKI